MTLVQGASAVPDATALIRVLAMMKFKRRPRSLEYSGPRSRRLSTVNFRMTIAKRVECHFECHWKEKIGKQRQADEKDRNDWQWAKSRVRKWFRAKPAQTLEL